jgi:hypothetical protein
VSATVEISDDATFSNIINTSDNIISDSLAYSFDDIGDYWWRVLLLDGAGNQSEFYLEERKVTIQ